VRGNPFPLGGLRGAMANKGKAQVGRLSRDRVIDGNSVAETGTRSGRSAERK
jgi:hypothetical protein